MENYKNKLRKGIGGFPTRCVGCLLALIVLLNSFTAFASPYTDSTTTDNIDISVLPDTDDLFFTYVSNVGTSAKYDVWLFVDDSVPHNYYLLFTHAFLDNNGQYQYSYIKNGTGLYTSFWQETPRISLGYQSSSINYNNQTILYYYRPDETSDWTRVTNNGEHKFLYNVAYGQYLTLGFNTIDCTLLAYHNSISYTDYSGTEPVNYVGYYSVLDSQVLYYVADDDLQCAFDSNGNLINNSFTPEPEEPEYNGLLGQIINWLTQIKNGITDFFTNFSTYLSNGISVIQGWLTNLGTTIGGFFTNLWSNLSTAFSSIGDWFSDLWLNISNGLTSLGNRISGFFTALVTNVKNLFIPSEHFFDLYKEDVQNQMHTHFGALYDSLEVTKKLFTSIGDLFSYEEPDDINIIFPRFRYSIRVNDRALQRINLNEQQIYSFNELTDEWQTRLNYQKASGGIGSIYLMDIWDSFVTASFALFLIYFLKKQINRILSNQFNVGDD